MQVGLRYTLAAEAAPVVRHAGLPRYIRPTACEDYIFRKLLPGLVQGESCEPPEALRAELE